MNGANVQLVMHDTQARSREITLRAPRDLVPGVLLAPHGQGNGEKREQTDRLQVRSRQG
jgi:hypothetical protein